MMVFEKQFYSINRYREKIENWLELLELGSPPCMIIECDISRLINTTGTKNK